LLLNPDASEGVTRARALSLFKFVQPEQCDNASDDEESPLIAREAYVAVFKTARRFPFVFDNISIGASFCRDAWMAQMLKSTIVCISMDFISSILSKKMSTRKHSTMSSWELFSSFSGHPRRQKNFIQIIHGTCSTMATTIWISMQSCSRSLTTNIMRVNENLGDKKPLRTPTKRCGHSFAAQAFASEACCVCVASKAVLL
jgi:hypothetical protein